MPKKTVEQCIGELYAAFIRLRQAGKIKEEYESMGTLMDMLAKDRDHIRKIHAKEIGL